MRSITVSLLNQLTQPKILHYLQLAQHYGHERHIDSPFQRLQLDLFAMFQMGRATSYFSATGQSLPLFGAIFFLDQHTFVDFFSVDAARLQSGHIAVDMAGHMFR